MTADKLRVASLLATDLDGTLLRDDETVSDYTRTAFADAAARGVRAIFVTGRPPRWMRPVVATTGHSGTAVCANGAVVVDLAQETVLKSNPIPGDVFAETVATVRRAIPGELYLAVEQALPGPISATGLFPEPGFVPAKSANVQQLDTPLHQVPGVVKLLVRTPGDPAETADLASTVSGATDGAVTITHASKQHRMLEISAAGVDKAAALGEIATDWKYDVENIVAVGDMPNDIAMLSWAGLGYAVTSAHPSVIAAADAVVPDPEHDGVAHLLTQIGLDNRI